MYKAVITLVLFFSLFTGFGQDAPTLYLEFDDTLRVQITKDKLIDTVNYATFKNYRKLKVVEIDVNSKETYLPVVGGDVTVTGVATTNDIDSTGTIVIPKYRSKTVLHMTNGRPFIITFYFENAEGIRKLQSVVLYGKV